ncbi:GIY-YIG nuclease family protein [bacterium]|nr:GIY-YIG nuclease family protein [bacterium]
MAKNYYVYILASKKNGTLYVGITSDLIKRVWQHKYKEIEGFTSQYNIDKLVYYEIFDDPENAINREKRIKKYKRIWKMNLIEANNPHWNDLYNDLLSGLPE